MYVKILSCDYRILQYPVIIMLLHNIHVPVVCLCSITVVHYYVDTYVTMPDMVPFVKVLLEDVYDVTYPVLVVTM